MTKRHGATPRRLRLTQRERRMLISCGELVLAGEWPFGDENMARQIVSLQNAIQKLKDSVDDKAP